MRTNTGAVVTGLMVLLSAGPALAQPVAAAGTSVSTQTVPAGSPAAERETYQQKARTELSTWQARMDQWGADAKGTTVAVASDADRDLHVAWSKLEAASQNLQSAGADGWDSAKRTYEQASDSLAAEWKKVHSEKT